MISAATNRPRLGDIRTMPIGEIAELPAPILALLQDEAEESVKAARHLCHDPEYRDGVIDVIGYAALLPEVLS